MSSYELCGMAAASLLLGSILVCKGGSLWLENRRLVEHGVTTDARIVGRHIRSEPKSYVKTFWVTANFVPIKKDRINAEAQVSEAYLKAHEDPRTSHVKVRYLAADPLIIVVDDQWRYSYSAIVGIPLVILSLIVSFFGVRKLWREPFWANSETGF